MPSRLNLSALAVTALLITGTGQAAHAGGSDADHDGIPNRWERTHGMDPRNARDAHADFDRDRLDNLAEYRAGSRIRDEDTDDDGHDDGDEVQDGFRGTEVTDRDTDGDRVLDGDEDSDHDGVDNEDEDDALETCVDDDDDRDHDSVSDEDENELHLVVGRADSDGDDVPDGDEDGDEDGQTNEDSDDHDSDRCDGDSDDDGRDDEDDGDVLGVIDSFDAATGILVVAADDGYTVTGTVTGDTEIELERERAEDDDRGAARMSGGDDEGTVDDLVPGTTVAELELDHRRGTLEEIAIYPAG